MNDSRPEDFDHAFGQLDAQRSQSENVNRMTNHASRLTVPSSGDEQIHLEFDTNDETARKRGLGLLQLRVTAFVMR